MNRSPGTNACTQIPRQIFQPGPVPFRSLFSDCYAAIRGLCEDEPEGLTVVAVGPGGLASARLEAAPGAIATCVLGRHEQAPLRLTGDGSVSLRHLAVLLLPREPGGDLRFRLLDLGTPLAVEDERGQRLESLEAEGPVFVSCGAHALFLFPTGDRLPWPERAAEGWACIPDRVYFCERPAAARRPPREHLTPTSDIEIVPGRCRALDHVTLVQTARGPVEVSRPALDEGDTLLGELRLASPDGEARVPVGRRAAARGLLLGRYSRCDRHARPVLASPLVSRVHVLLLEVAGRLHAIDTASTNGLALGDGTRVRQAALEVGQTLMLGGLVRLDWSGCN
jgi:hypothetical protein